MLHPDISKGCLEKKEIWIPGHLSETYSHTSGDKKIVKIGGGILLTSNSKVKSNRWI